MLPGSGGGWNATTRTPAIFASSCCTIGCNLLVDAARRSHGFSAMPEIDWPGTSIWNAADSDAFDDRVLRTDNHWLWTGYVSHEDGYGRFKPHHNVRTELAHRVAYVRWVGPIPDAEPIIDLNSGGGRLIFERAGHLHSFDPSRSHSEQLKIGVATDLVEARPRFVKGAKYVRHGAISPSGEK